MHKSLGTLIDRLIVTNQRLWAVVDWHWSLTGPEDLQKQGNQYVYEQLKKLKDLNKLRNELVKEIDECLDSLEKKTQ